MPDSAGSMILKLHLEVVSEQRCHIPAGIPGVTMLAGGLPVDVEQRPFSGVPTEPVLVAPDDPATVSIGWPPAKNSCPPVTNDQIRATSPHGDHRDRRDRSGHVTSNVGGCRGSPRCSHRSGARSSRRTSGSASLETRTSPSRRDRLRGQRPVRSSSTCPDWIGSRQSRRGRAASAGHADGAAVRDAGHRHRVRHGHLNDGAAPGTSIPLTSGDITFIADTDDGDSAGAGAAIAPGPAPTRPTWRPAPTTST